MRLFLESEGLRSVCRAHLNCGAEDLLLQKSGRIRKTSADSAENTGNRKRKRRPQTCSKNAAATAARKWSRRKDLSRSARKPGRSEDLPVRIPVPDPSGPDCRDGPRIPSCFSEPGELPWRRSCTRKSPGTALPGCVQCSRHRTSCGPTAEAASGPDPNPQLPDDLLRCVAFPFHDSLLARLGC